MARRFDNPDQPISWCPGCGNFIILNLLKTVFEELDFARSEVVIASGIGQAARTPYYMDANMFAGLHGRAIPMATGMKSANPKLTVVAEGGDGDMYGEGGNHFLNAVRRDMDMVNIVHNNMVYGLTKGQASPTSQKGFTTKVQVDGVSNEPFNPLSIALAAGAGFVARISVTDFDHAKEVLKRAFTYEGYALVDIFQPCVTFNKVNGYDFFEKHTYKLGQDHDMGDFSQAMEKAMEKAPFPLGVFYEKPLKTFTAAHHIEKPLFENVYDKRELQKLYDTML